jgi:hypothetical protein
MYKKTMINKFNKVSKYLNMVVSNPLVLLFSNGYCQITSKSDQAESFAP